MRTKNVLPTGGLLLFSLLAACGSEETKSIRIVFVSDLEGYLEECG